MKASRIAAVGLVAVATLWIASGYLFPHESPHSRAAPTPAGAAKLFPVGTIEARVEPHSRKLALSGRTEADRKVMVTARASGVITEINVRRGQHVNQGDVIAVLSDEAREAQVAQARAVLAQRKAEFEARSRLIAQGTLPKLDLGNLEAQYKGAEAALAAAEAERDRGVVRAPWSGIVNDVPVEVGQAAFSMAGKEIAQMIALDPILAVGEVAERRVSGFKVGDPAEIRLVTGETAKGRVRFISKTASNTTRTYRVEVEVANPTGAIPDGITAEMMIWLAPAPSARVPRSALTFSSAGDLGVRIVQPGDKVAFVPVTLVEDEQEYMWVAGLEDRARVIVQGQDFVREGQLVEAQPAQDARTAER